MDPHREEDRRAIFEALERTYGAEMARRMMAYMSPFPWEELATKADLASLEGRMDNRFDQVDARLDQVDARLDQIDTRLDQIDTRLDQIDTRLDRTDARSDRFPTHADLEATEQRLLAAFRGELVAAVTTQTRMLLIGLIGTALTFGALLVAATRLA